MLLLNHEWKYVEKNGKNSQFSEKYFHQFEDNPEFLRDSVIFWTLRGEVSWAIVDPDEKIEMMLEGHVWKKE